MDQRDPAAHSWLGRFGSPLPIRARGAFHFYACADRDGSAAVVVVGAPRADSTRVAECLDQLAHAHDRISHPRVPRVSGRDRFDGVDWLAFDCDAVTDLESLMEKCAALGRRAPYPCALGVSIVLAEALAAAHERADPLCLGSLSLANLLVSPSGRLHVLGFGHNVAIARETGSVLGVPGVFMAPEVAAGAAPTPASDVKAMITMMRSLAAYAELPAPLERLLRGQPRPEDVELVETMRAVDERIVGALPGSGMASVAEALAAYRHKWSLLGVTPDVDGLASFSSELLSIEAIAERAPDVREVLVAEDGSFVQPPGAGRYRIPPRSPLRRLLVAFARRRLEQPRTPLDVDALVEAGWPGERVVPEAAANRVYVAIANLRKLGMRDILRRESDGYLIDAPLRLV